MKELAAVLVLTEVGALFAIRIPSTGCLELIGTLLEDAGMCVHVGLRLVAVANQLHIRTIAVVPDKETDMEVPLRTARRGLVIGHIQHTAGIGMGSLPFSTGCKHGGRT